MDFNRERQNTSGSIIAPRIRLAPQELKNVHRTLLRLRETAHLETQQPQPVALNLSHQCLGDAYQITALAAFLALHKSVQLLNLNDNELDDIADLELPSVVKLHLSHNNIVSFHALPQLPNCEELHLRDNFISSMSGLTHGKFPKLKRLTTAANPIEHLSTYPSFIFDQLPQLHKIDQHERKTK